MSVLSQFIGGSSILVGQSIPMQGALANFTDGSMEFLRSGYLKAYSSTYSAYKNRNPGGCYIRQVPVDNIANSPTLSANVTNSSGVISYSGTNYQMFLSATTGGMLWAYKSTNLINWSYAGNYNTWTNINQMFDYCVTSNGNIVVCTNDTGGSTSVKLLTNGNFTDPASAVFGNQMGSASASPSRVLVTGRNQSTNTTNAIFTSDDNGNTWTTRTGSGGTNMTMVSSFYSPCSSAFFILAVDQSAGNQGNLILNKTTDGFTQTVGLTSDSSFKVVSSQFDGGNKNRYIASSPTVTLISNGNGLLKRTVDGNTWTNVNLTSQIGTDVLPTFDNGGNSVGSIYYSSVTSKFYYVTANTSTGVRYITSTDGLTWVPTFTFLSDQDSYTYAFSLSTANSKVLIPVINSSSYRVRILDVTTKIAQTDPDFIGIPATTMGSVPAYTRIL